MGIIDWNSKLNLEKEEYVIASFELDESDIIQAKEDNVIFFNGGYYRLKKDQVLLKGHNIVTLIKTYSF